MAECPYCGGTFVRPNLAADLDSNHIEVEGRRVRVPPINCELFYVLVNAYPMSARPEIIDAAIWGTASGPEGIRKTVLIVAHEVRKALTGTGWTVRSTQRSKYQLVRVGRRDKAGGCPYCGGEYEQPPLRADMDRFFIEAGGHRVKAEPRVCGVFAALAANQTSTLSDERLAVHIWGAIGCPGDLRATIHVYIWKLRKALTGTGWAVKNFSGDGYRLLAA